MPAETTMLRTYFDTEKTELREVYFEVNGKREGELGLEYIP
jgi:hypothetical protein